MDFFTTVGAIGSAITIAEQGNKIKKKLNKIVHYIVNGNCRIIVFGAGGTGKTTLAYVLSNKEISDFDYSETATIEKINLNADVFGQYLVAPGQPRRVERYWPDLFRKLGANKITGVINVVSYGYHSVDIGQKSYKSTSYYSEDRESNFLEDFLIQKREEEIKYLKKIADSIKNTPNKFWMITLVNKQDLWWEDKELVKQHYFEGEYNSVIEEIFKSKGDKNFVHEYVSCALFNCNFKIGSDYKKDTVQGYDEPIKRSNFNNFLTLLKALINERL